MLVIAVIVIVVLVVVEMARAIWNAIPLPTGDHYAGKLRQGERLWVELIRRAFFKLRHPLVRASAAIAIAGTPDLDRLDSNEGSLCLVCPGSQLDGVHHKAYHCEETRDLWQELPEDYLQAARRRPDDALYTKGWSSTPPTGAFAEDSVSFGPDLQIRDQAPRLDEDVGVYSDGSTYGHLIRSASGWALIAVDADNKLLGGRVGAFGTSRGLPRSSGGAENLALEDLSEVAQAQGVQLVCAKVDNRGQSLARRC